MSLGKFVMTKGKSWSGLTLKNHIGAIFGSQPQLVSPLTTVLLQNSGMKNLDTTLSLFPEKVLETSDDFVWKVVGSDERNIALVEARVGGVTVLTGDSGVGAARLPLVPEEERTFGKNNRHLFFSDKFVPRIAADDKFIDFESDDQVIIL